MEPAYFFTPTQEEEGVALLGSIFNDESTQSKTIKITIITKETNQ